VAFLHDDQNEMCVNALQEALQGLSDGLDLLGPEFFGVERLPDGSGERPH
jgi:hypothetical protein